MMLLKQLHRPALALLVVSVLGAFAIGMGVGAPANANAPLPREGASAEPPTFGGVSDAMYDADGAIRLDRVPDLIEVADHAGGIAGYAWKTDVFAPAESSSSRPTIGNIPVYDETGTDLRGFLIPDRGFVDLDSLSSGEFLSQTLTTVTFVNPG